MARLQGTMRLAGRACLVVLLLLTACHTMRFEVTDEPHVEEVRVRKAFFLGGLAPTRRVDLGEICPQGVMAVKEETTFGDGFFDLITLSIYSPRTSVYYCRGEASP